MIWAWMGAVAVGLSLGLLGSGGAILTVPILVYLVGHDEKSAIAESLAIVGAIATVGVARSALQRRVDFASAALLALPGILGAAAGAHAAQFIPGAVQLVLLAVLMLTAAVLMFKSRSRSAATPDDSPPAHAARGPLWIIAVQGLGLGFATGLVGVGGGFLIVPVLVLLRRLPMPLAIGTSLAIIAVNSTTGSSSISRRWAIMQALAVRPFVSIGTSSACSSCWASPAASSEMPWRVASTRTHLSGSSRCSSS